MSRIIPNSIVYSASGDRCVVKSVGSETFSVVQQKVSRVTFDGKTSQEIRNVENTFSIHDQGVKWFLNRSEADNYLISGEQRRRQKQIDENAPRLPQMNNKMKNDLLVRYMDSNLSIQDEQSNLQYILNIVKSKRSEIDIEQVQPYFARMDFDLSYYGGRYYQKMYIGKNEIYGKGDIVVYDWRSRIGGLYYKKTDTRISIMEGAYKYDYELLLRRRLTIQSASITKFHNEYVFIDLPGNTVTDEFLVDLLRKRMRTPGMKDIILSIQKLQNEIIRLPINRNVVVQGCAGSGKTMIMLHRLSLLKFQNPGLNLKLIRILTPSHHFDVAVNDLAAELDIGSIPVRSVQDYYSELHSRYGMQIDRKNKTVASESIVDDALVRELYSVKSRRKVEEIYTRCLNEIAEEFKPSYLKKASGIVGFDFSLRPEYKAGIELLQYYHNAASKIWYEQESNKNQEADLKRDLEGIERKLGDKDKQLINIRERLIQMEPIVKLARELEIKKQKCAETENRFVFKKEQINRLQERYDGMISLFFWARKKINEEIGIASEELNKLTQMRSGLISDIESMNRELLSQSIAQGFEDFAALKKAYSQFGRELDAKSNELGNLVALITEREYIGNQLNELRKRIIADDLMALVTAAKEKPITPSNEISKRVLLEFRKDALQSMSGILKSKIFKFDWYFTLIICYAHLGSLTDPDRMLNIDEGQDLYEQEYKLLHEINGKRVIFNIYGDLKQRLNPNAGLEDWRAIKQFNFDYFHLDENYRNTVQITDFANQMFKMKMNAVGIQDKNVEQFSYLELPLKVTRFLASEGQDKAIIVKNEEVFSRLCESGILPGESCNLISESEQEQSTSQINVFSVAMAKGLEFQQVMVISKDMNMNEKYISVTRALLTLLYCE